MSLPLKSKTTDEWAKRVLKDPVALLSDHAYLERKAATNALQLLNCWPEPHHPPEWTDTLTTIARDETQHLNSVIKLLKKRKGKLQRSHRNQYATDLRLLVRKGLGPKEILDRLLISALIEARSCERFEVLARACTEPELAAFYKRLWASELNHYKIFLNLAEKIVPPLELKSRWDVLLTEEAKIMEKQPTGPRIHSGLQ